MPRQQPAESNPKASGQTDQGKLDQKTPGQNTPNQEAPGSKAKAFSQNASLGQRASSQGTSERGASSTLTIYHDGQFWVGVIERIDDGLLTAARVVFGAEPSDEEVLQFVLEHWNALIFSPETKATRKEQSKNPKRRQREASKEASVAMPSTKAQQAIAEMREQNKEAAREKFRSARKDAAAAKYEQRKSRHKQKHRGH